MGRAEGPVGSTPINQVMQANTLVASGIQQIVV